MESKKEFVVYEVWGRGKEPYFIEEAKILDCGDEFWAFEKGAVEFSIAYEEKPTLWQRIRRWFGGRFRKG